MQVWPDITWHLRAANRFVCFQSVQDHSSRGGIGINEQSQPDPSTSSINALYVWRGRKVHDSVPAQTQVESETFYRLNLVATLERPESIMTLTSFYFIPIWSEDVKSNVLEVRTHWVYYRSLT